MRTREQLRATAYKTNRNIGSRFCNIRNTAKRRGLSFNIPLSHYSYLVSTECFYCEKQTLGTEMGGGLDRIDNTKGYVIGNVLPCCGFCNNARGTHWSVEEFKLITQTIAEFRRTHERQT